MDWTLLIQFLVGGTFISFISTMVTMKASRKKADAEAKAIELDNVQDAITIYREMAESFKNELVRTRSENGKITEQIEKLGKEVAKLTNVTVRVLKLLDKITPDNLESTITEIRNEIHNRTA